MSYLDKLKPVSKAYESKLKPIGESAPRRRFGQKVLDAGTEVTRFLGLQPAADTIGTNLANIANALDPRTSLDQKIAMSKALPQATLKQNIGAGMQLGPLVASGGASAPVRLGKAVLTSGIVGGAQGAGGSLGQNESMKDVAAKGAVGFGVGGAVGGSTVLAGKLLEKLGGKIQYALIKPTQADIKDGFTLATIKKHNLGGSLPKVFNKTEAKMDSLTKQLNEKLAASNSSVDLQEVFKKTFTRLTAGTGKLSSFGSNKALEGAFKQLQGEVANVGTRLSVPEAQVVKRAAGHYGAWQYGMFDPESTARQKVYNVFYNELKTAIEKSSPSGVRGINKELSDLIPVLNAVIRRIPVAERNNALSLTDVISLVGASINPNALGVTLAGLMSRSGGVANALMKLGPKVQSTAVPLGTGASLMTSSLQSQARIFPER